ncbi:MAG: DUF3299 domain-containing protein [Planctomycetes bacterium]|nr:DUF3299 domain-containing protein [Planctomycetota bacterium]
MRTSWLWLLAATVAVGCAKSNPESSTDKGNEPVVQPEPQPEPKPPKKEPSADEIQQRIKNESIVVFLVLPNKPEFAVSNIVDKVASGIKRELDELPPLKLETTGGGWFLQVTTSPVKDVEAFGRKQTLGRILALDPEKRRVLIEYGAPPSPRESWQDATFLDKQVMVRSARWGTLPPPSFPAEQVVYVRFRGDWSSDAFVVQGKLKALLDGPVEKRHVWALDRDLSSGTWGTAIAPVTDLAALAKKVDFAEVLHFDTEHNALILGHKK